MADGTLPGRSPRVDRGHRPGDAGSLRPPPVPGSVLGAHSAPDSSRSARDPLPRGRRSHVHRLRGACPSGARRARAALHDRLRPPRPVRRSPSGGSARRSSGRACAWTTSGPMPGTPRPTPSSAGCSRPGSGRSSRCPFAGPIESSAPSSPPASNRDDTRTRSSPSWVESPTSSAPSSRARSSTSANGAAASASWRWIACPAPWPEVSTSGTSSTDSRRPCARRSTSTSWGRLSWTRAAAKPRSWPSSTRRLSSRRRSACSWSTSPSAPASDPVSQCWCTTPGWSSILGSPGTGSSSTTGAVLFSWFRCGSATRWGARSTSGSASRPGSTPPTWRSPAASRPSWSSRSSTSGSARSNGDWPVSSSGPVSSSAAWNPSVSRSTSATDSTASSARPPHSGRRWPWRPRSRRPTRRS